MNTDISKEEIVPKLMDVLFRFRRLYHRSPIPGLKHSETRMLFIINKRAETRGGISITELSNHLRVTSPTVTQRINALEEMGLTERAIDPDDRRSIKVSLTEKGREAIKKSSETFYALYSQLADHLGKEKSLLLIELLSETFDYLSIQLSK